MFVLDLPYSDIEQVTRLAEGAIDEISADLINLSFQIHDNPEISSHEYSAHKLLTTYLKNYGFQVDGVDGMDTAFVATWKVQGKNDEKRTIAFMSEYDALPELGHGCGHNLIAISGVAAAIGCIRALEKLQVSAIIKLYGTPAEEMGAGKIQMIDKKVFEETEICMMVHPANVNGAAPIMFALQAIKVDYYGRSSHASTAPWDGINAMDAAVLAYQSVGLLRQQMKRTQQVHGIITHGGAAPNIIPEHTSSNYFIRAESVKDLDDLRERVERCFAAAATATGCTYKLDKDAALANVHTNHTLANAWTSVMTSRGAKFPTPEELRAHAGGSTDMGNVTWYRPGIHPMFDIDTTASLHTLEFAKAARTPEAQKRCLQAAVALATVGVRVAAETEFYQLAVDEFKRTTSNTLSSK
ncbi:hypothetical protein BDF19DRAFT_484828 [Syncephalis fuscata]|nr:hypothetical protein BDF19DRAFT_484828 [Syncephalis fuscata]